MRLKIAACSFVPPCSLVDSYECFEEITTSFFRLTDSYDMIYLTAIGLTPGGSSRVHIYTQTIYEQHNGHKTIQRTTQLIHGTTQLRKKSAGRYIELLEQTAVHVK